MKKSLLWMLNMIASSTLLILDRHISFPDNLTPIPLVRGLDHLE